MLIKSGNLQTLNLGQNGFKMQKSKAVIFATDARYSYLQKDSAETLLGKVLNF